MMRVMKAPYRQFSISTYPSTFLAEIKIEPKINFT